MKLEDAANYVRTSKASSTFLAFVKIIKRIYTFTEERANRLTRYVAITRAYKSGRSVESIVNKYGCSRNTVLRYARLAKLPKRPKHLPVEIKKAVIADYRLGLPVADIAKLHDVSISYVSTIAHKEGLSRYASPQR